MGRVLPHDVHDDVAHVPPQVQETWDKAAQVEQETES